MTQTMKNDNPPPSSRKGRPGQRQQERLERLARRRRRMRIIASILISILLIVIAVSGIVFDQKYQTDQTNAHNADATATVNAQNINATATYTGLNVQATAIVKAQATSTPAGPAAPPPVVGTPKKLSDGLQYVELQEGSGPAAKSGQTVSVEYTGWIQSTGKKFDSSYDRGADPISFELGQNQVIPGWDEGLTGMKVGESRRLIIPPSLGYGSQAQKDSSGKVVIPANATLIFDVTVVNIQATTSSSTSS